MNLPQNENNPFITKLITILPDFIHQQYKIQHYQVIQPSIQIQMFVLLTTLLSIMTMKALSKIIPKQITVLLRHLFKRQ